MNIFYLDRSPLQAARFLCDKHVVKMVLETAQLACSVYHLSSTHKMDIPYKLTHGNHPCAKWARHSYMNFVWLLDHGFELSSEYTWRYGKIHKSERVFAWARDHINYLYFPEQGLTHPPACMYKHFAELDLDIVERYRLYYRAKEQEIDMRWTKRPKPEFLNSEV